MINFLVKTMGKKKFVFTFILFFFYLQVFNISAQESFKVVLDPGHGGTDPGNLGNGYYEKDIVLKIAIAVGKLLDKDKE